MAPTDSVKISMDSLKVLQSMAKKGLESTKVIAWEDFWVIVALILVSGVLGGVVNYYFNLKTAPDQQEPHTLIRSIVIGIGAAILVPIFLEITQSKVLEGVILHQLVHTILFVSFCVLAATISSRFISSVSDSVMSRLKQVEKKADDAKKGTEATAKAVEQRGGTKTLSETTKKLMSASVAMRTLNADDPQKGQFGGSSKNADFELILARTEQVEVVKGWYNLTFKVQAIDPSNKPLKGEVIFFLHPTFRPDVVPVNVSNGVALLSRIAWGAFTVGVELPDGSKLEYDLANDSNLPDDFKSR